MNLKLETYLRGKLLLLLNCWITQKVSPNLKLGLDLGNPHFRCVWSSNA